MLKRSGPVATIVIATFMLLAPRVASAIPVGQTTQAPATAARAPAVTIIHSPVRPEQLSFPGERIAIRVLVEGTRDYEQRLRTFAVIDGVLSEIAPSKAYLNENDLATYEVDLFAPIADLAYQFVLYGRDGTTVASSPRFSVRRACIPVLDSVAIQDTEKFSPGDRIVTLQREASALGFELASLESALAVVGDLRSRLPKK